MLIVAFCAQALCAQYESLVNAPPGTLDVFFFSLWLDDSLSPRLSGEMHHLSESEVTIHMHCQGAGKVTVLLDAGIESLQQICSSWLTRTPTLGPT